MDANRNEAQKCIKQAFEYFRSGNVEQSQKLLSRAYRMCPSLKTRSTKYGRPTWWIKLFVCTVEEDIKTAPLPEPTPDNADKYLHEAFEYFKNGNLKKSQEYLTLSDKIYFFLQSQNYGVESQTTMHSDSSNNVNTTDSMDANDPVSVHSGDCIDTAFMREIRRINNADNYYELLQINENSTEAGIKYAYKHLLLKVHPDKNDYPGASEAFQAIRIAYDTLIDPDRRYMYDLWLSNPDYASRKY